MPSRSSYRRLGVLVATAVVFSVALVIAGALGREQSQPAAAPTRQVIANPVIASGRVPGASLEQTIDALRNELDRLPNDYVSWATLGLAYVQQARIAVDPSYYELAEGALERSIEVQAEDNFIALAGWSALASARHDFTAAAAHATEGLEINSYSAILYGALSDAQIQLGQYDDGFESLQEMLDLAPDTASLTRASYSWELRGDLDRATELMTRALDDAPSASDRAFATFYLGQLAFIEGDLDAASELFERAVSIAPGEPAMLAGQARAEAASGRTDAAIEHYAEVVEQAPDPGYVLEYGRLLESLGRDAEAQQQYDVVGATLQLFAAQGVEPDSVLIRFEADHGDLDEAVRQAEQGVAERPFIDMYDAQAWALHRAGRDEEALHAIDQALELGTPYASYHYHAGMISLALGDDDRALEELRRALQLNADFDPLDAPIAERTISELEGTT